MKSVKKIAAVKDLPLSDHEARRICEAAERMTKHLGNPSVHVACAWSAAREALLDYLTDRGYSVTISDGGISFSRAAPAAAVGPDPNAPLCPGILKLAEGLKESLTPCARSSSGA